jgi:hypothetical protein
MFNATEAGTYKVEALVNATDTCSLYIEINERKTKTEIIPTNEKFEIIQLGEIEISETGNTIISLSPDRENWKEIKLMYLELIKK